ncbi:MAG: hypothetical protein EBS36_05810 [Actinobacteria bacterium]|nr:hypothetical protein [Actinomycetota bacterium]NBY15904.1 hypothetical protein [Actinomycetota bacterium]
MAKRVSFILAVVLTVYLGFAFWRGVDLVRAGNTPVIILGICVMVLPILGGWLVIREVQFGYKSTEMGKQIAVNRLPSMEIKPRTVEAQNYLDAAIEAAKRNQNDWQNWFCVAVGYDLVGNRKLARESMQYAVELFDQF